MPFLEEMLIKTVPGWNTIGAIEVGALVDGRASITFMDLDGLKRTIFIPGPTVGQLAAHLASVAATLAKTHPELAGTPIPTKKNVN